MTKEQLLEKALKLYAGDHVLKRVLDLGENAFIREGETIEGTIYTQSINDFSHIAESKKPEELLQDLSQYLDASIIELNANHGIIDSIIADSIVSYWNITDTSKDANLACNAALASMQGNGKLNNSMSSNIYIGIHSDKFIVCNFGSQYRLIHTIMGDAFNFSSRLSNANKYYNTNILISESTKEKLDDVFILREIDTILIVGKNDPIKIYELFSRKSEINSKQLKMLGQFHEGLGEYNKRNWEDALKIFKSIHKNYKHDGPTKVYLERCKSFQDNPPGKGWNGAVTIR